MSRSEKQLGVETQTKRVHAVDEHKDRYKLQLDGSRQDVNRIRRNKGNSENNIHNTHYFNKRSSFRCANTRG